MQLLRKVVSVNPPKEESKVIYIMFIRSLLEQSCTVWHSRISLENKEDLERIKKSSLKIILQERYINYQNTLNVMKILSFDEKTKISANILQRKM